MSTETWGNMPKSLDDAETPEEMAERVVEAHNDDPDAHLEEGQSLTSHRANEIIDHVARSIVGDKISTVEDVSRAIFAGTVTDFGTNWIEDTTQNWEVNSLVGHYLFTGDGPYPNMGKQITSNTATRITCYSFSGEGWDIGSAYGVSALKGSGYWFDGPYSTFPFSGRTISSATATDYVYRTFNCNLLTLICVTGPNCGKIDIYIDDELDSTVDLYTAGTCYRARVWEKSWATTADRTIKVVVRSDKNPSSTAYNVWIGAFDVNGTVSFCGLNTEVYTVVSTVTTNSNGYVRPGFDPPEGYCFITCLGVHTTGMNSGSVTTPKIYFYPMSTGYYVALDEGQPSTSFTITVTFLIYPKEPYFEG